MKPRGAGSVMASHAPAIVVGDSDVVALHRRLQFFPTPPWAARAGGELIQYLDPGAWVAWEPACGQGHMAYGLGDYFPRVIATDIHDHGWVGQDGVLDFMQDDAGVWTFAGKGVRDAVDQVDWIISNPPFKQAPDFVRLGLRRARRGVAMLCRLSFFETDGRYSLFYGPQGLTAVAPFFERVPMALGGWDPGGSTATAYAWFVWMHDAILPPWLLPTRNAGMAVAPGIMPGTCARLTRRDDARLFGRETPAPLFDLPPERPAP